MAKKRKGLSAKVGNANATSEPVPNTTSEKSKVQNGAYCIRSSLGVPFLLVTNRSFVASVPAPSVEDWTELLALATRAVQEWSARGAVLLTDFEGEFTGFEGELVSAAFQRTFAVNAKGLRPMPTSGVCKDMGLLIDLRCPDGGALVKQIMESTRIAKMIWGADGDVTSLRYTPILQPLGICAANVVDVQLAYSTQENRLGMGKMLERLPPKTIAGLPSKECIDFDTAHSLHHRAMALPLEVRAATYAVDDLHRLDAILTCQRPADGSYSQAECQTSAFLSRLLSAPSIVSAVKLRQYGNMLNRRSPGDTKRVVLAVRIKRHLVAIKHLVPGEGGLEFGALEAEVDKILLQSQISIPSNLSFGTNGESVTSANVKAIERSAPNRKRARPKSSKKLVKKKKPLKKSVSLVLDCDVADCAVADAGSMQKVETMKTKVKKQPGTRKKARKRKANSAS